MNQDFNLGKVFCTEGGRLLFEILIFRKNYYE